ncbi:four helix bundle protein, partial [bacterium]|nr:four helix bundle protein [bacterium]
MLSFEVRSIYGLWVSRKIWKKRLIGFAVSVIEVAEGLPNTKAGNHVAGQLIRSGTSPTPNYGEARSAESRNQNLLKGIEGNDGLWLRIIERKPLSKTGGLSRMVSECDQSISIFLASLKIAESKNIRNPKS